MSNALDDLRQTLNKLDTHGSGYVHAGEAADAIIAALPGMVKPLEWDDFAQRAETFAGVYRFEDGSNYHETGKRWVAWTFNDEDPYHHGEQAGSIEAAKAAAQAHHVAQTMAAFGIDGEST